MARRSMAAPESGARLVRIPTDSDLARMYAELAERGASAVGRLEPWPYEPASDEVLICLAAEMSRHDPRLLGIVVELVLKTWTGLSPMRLREAMRAMRRPQVVCVIVAFAREATHDREFAHWARHVCADWSAVTPSEHFFVDDVRPGERTAARRMGRSLRSYSSWGFHGIERPTIEPHRKQRVGRYDARTRRDILGQLVRDSTDGVTLADYLERLDGTVSRQTALADFHAIGLRTRSHGPGARWTGPPRRRA